MNPAVQVRPPRQYFGAALASAVLPDPGLPDLFGDSAPPPPQFTLMLALPPEAAAALHGEPDLRVTLTGTPDATLYDDAAAGAMEASAAATVQAQGEVSEALLGRVLAVLPAAEHAAVTDQVRQHNERVAAARAPAQRGVPFTAVPRHSAARRADQPSRPRGHALA